MFARVSNQVARRAATQARGFRKGSPTKFTENKMETGVADSILVADNSKYTIKALHATSLALTALVPTAIILSPSALNLPVDYALAVLIPVHSHIGLNAVASDYVPKNLQTLVRAGILGASFITLVGLLNLNITGSGVTETVKTIWRERPAPKGDHH
ncbi:Aste57867_8084 [Aphanomyces stellatus]|uniref:Succinate dehydrogenase [ubiquinone] cytochrome b small subunit n=1 Tax=Aphanomyces stellatus TaxID=120398 RepID=A0A485KJC5_9STRA|nr:hypothetical protein As57867_008054 [Aphanomyces stellatus]VFT84973.1 Aste57867_8084 [Aphanomyces stellatus]